MAELHLTIPYSTVPGRIALSIMATLSPLWAIAAPCWLGYFIGSTLHNPAGVTITQVIATCGGMFLLILLAIAMTAVAEDNRIHVTKDGVTFPLYMLPGLRFQRHLNWDELRQASLISANAPSAKLLLAMRTGVSVVLKTSLIARTDLEQLLLSIELWSTQCQRSPELVALQRSVQNEGRAEGSIGHTQMWEEELSRRFSATTFLPLEPETRLQNGHLKVVRQLAFGGLSAIYLVQRNNAELVVLKESVVPAGANSEIRLQAEEHLAREAALLSNLNHPNIAKVFDHFVEDGRHYIVLEYIKGQDLRQYIKQNGSVSESRALEWGLVIANILTFLHSQVPPVIHRDLTPDNLVLTNDGQLILIDFGAANQFVGTATGTIVGKQAYIPAEQLRGKTVPQSDIYALAGTLQFLLTGKDPTPLAQCNPRKFNPEVSAALDELLGRCTDFEPADRVQTAREVAEELERIKAANRVRLTTAGDRS